MNGKRLSQEKTDKTFKLITSNGCREMEEIRFNQAVNEMLPDYIVDFQKYINEVIKLLLCSSTGISDNRVYYNFTPLEVLNDLDYFSNKMSEDISAGIALYMFGIYKEAKINIEEEKQNG